MFWTGQSVHIASACLIWSTYTGPMHAQSPKLTSLRMYWIDNMHTQNERYNMNL